MMKTIILFLTWLAVAECFYNKQQLRETRVKVRQILSLYEELLSRTHGDASVFTETMKFEIQTEYGETISLSLHLDDEPFANLITEVLVDEDVYGEFDFGRDRDYRFYQNLDYGAAMKVKCPNYVKPCTIVGVFVYEDTPYEIKNGVAIDLTDEFDHALFEIPDFKDIDRSSDTLRMPLGEPEKKRLLEEDIDNLLMYLEDKEGTKINSRTTTVKNYKIEMHFVVVYDVYDKFFSIHKDRDVALQSITELIQQTGNEMDMIFALSYKGQDKYKYTFDVVPLKLTILETKTASKWFADHVQTDANNKLSFQGSDALMSFYQWGNTHMDPKADAIMYFTGADMKNGESSGTIGLAGSYANFNALCKRDGYFSFSSVEIGVGLTGSTAAHELVHTFGVDHDGIAGSSCPASDQYLMASHVNPNDMSSSKAQNPFKLSSCSLETINSNLHTIPVVNGKTCLEVHSYDVAKYDKILKGPYLGARYNANAQCQFALGAKSGVCTNTGISQEDICWRGLSCKVNGLCDTTKQIQPFIGTPCGSNKVCMLGKCVDSTTSSDTTVKPKPVTTTNQPVTTSGFSDTTSGFSDTTTGW